MQESTNTVQAELQTQTPFVSPASISGNLYLQKLENAVIRSAHEASYRLLDLFNDFCAKHDVEYFAIAGTLAGTYSYADFIPGTSVIEVGMLRSEYLKFEEAYYAEGGTNTANYRFPSPTEYLSFSQASMIELLEELSDNDERVSEIEPDRNANPVAALLARVGSIAGSDGENQAESANVKLVSDEGTYVRYVKTDETNTLFTLTSHYDAQRKLHVRMPTLQFPGYCMATENGHVVYGTDHMPVVFGVGIQISVFDAIPDDYDFARALFKQLKLLDTLSSNPAASVTGINAVIRNRAWCIADSYNDKPHREVSRLVPTRSQPIRLDDISPVKMMPFGTTQIACPANPGIWVVEDVDTQMKQVELLQLDAKAIISEIDRICRANDIGYFICGGTMLGYVRHGGFIPWDDDMDIGMLRADYERFLEAASEQLDTERFFLQTRESDPNIPYLFSKVRMKNSEYITKYNEFRDFDKGICVDVFPFDRVPFETGELPGFREIVRQKARAHNKVANRQVGAMPSTEPSTLGERLSREVMTIRHEHYWKKSLADTQQDYEDTVTQFNDREDFHYVASFVPTFTMVDLDDLLPYKDADFDGLVLKVPNNPEIFLGMQYGDYMTMPMPHQQRGHALIWWSDPEHDAGEFGTQKNDHAPTRKHSSKVSKYALPCAAAIAATAVAALGRGFKRGK